MNSVSGDGWGATKYQKTKWLICTALSTFHKPPEASCEQLVDDISSMLTIQAIRSCCSRLSRGYRYHKPKYHRHYLRKMHYTVSVNHPQAVYRLLTKGSNFLVRMNRQHPGVVAQWTHELIESRKTRDEMAKFMREHLSPKKPEGQGSTCRARGGMYAMTI